MQAQPAILHRKIVNRARKYVCERDRERQRDTEEEKGDVYTHMYRQDRISSIIYAAVNPS